MKPIVACFVLLFVASVMAAEPTEPGKQLLIKIQVMSGDPNGSVEAGTLKILAAPQLVTVENRPASLTVLDTVPLVDEPTRNEDYAQIGIKADLHTGEVADGKVKIHFKLSKLEVVTLDGQPTRIVRSRAVQTVVVAKLGEKFKISGLGQGTEHHWIEVTVEDGKLV